MNWKLPDAQVSRAGFLLLFCFSIGACSNTRHFEWTEDVQLSDGRTIVVQRSEEARRVTDPGVGFRAGWLFQKATIFASLPSPVSRNVSWEGNLSPLVIDIQPDSATYLVCLVATGSGGIEWHVPRNEFYVVFRLTNEGWTRIPLNDLPLSATPNLLPYGVMLIKHGASSGVHLDLKYKEELGSKFGPYDRERTIARPPDATKH